jgi:hypothetical protein
MSRQLNCAAQLSRGTARLSDPGVRGKVRAPEEVTVSDAELWGVGGKGRVRGVSPSDFENSVKCGNDNGTDARRQWPVKETRVRAL